MSERSRELADRLNSAFSQHEALHTAHVLAETYAEHVLEHPWVQGNAEVRALAQEAVDRMLQVYVVIGSHTDPSTMTSREFRWRKRVLRQEGRETVRKDDSE